MCIRDRLSIPMLCGPGAIANGIMLMDDANTWTMKGILIGIIGLIYFITYLISVSYTHLNFFYKGIKSGMDTRLHVLYE